jgi:hypothetical protein
MSPPIPSPMLDRHLRDGVLPTGPALDDIVARGSAAVWLELRDILAERPNLRAPFHFRRCIPGG